MSRLYFQLMEAGPHGVSGRNVQEPAMAHTSGRGHVTSQSRNVEEHVWETQRRWRLATKKYRVVRSSFCLIF